MLLSSSHVLRHIFLLNLYVGIFMASQAQNLTTTPAAPRSCQPSLRVTDILNYTNNDQYDTVFEGASVYSELTLDDCSKCQAIRNVVFGVSNRTKRMWVYIGSQSAAKQIEVDKLHRELLLSRRDVPDWILDSIVLPYYDRFEGPNSTQKCFVHRPARPEDYATRRVVDLGTLRTLPLETECWLLVSRWHFRRQAEFIYAFHGFRPFNEWHTGNGGVYRSWLFKSEAVERGLRIASLLLAFSTPTTILLLIFALHVIGKSLHASDSHVYHYHKALTVTDILVAIFLCLKETSLMKNLFLPFCLAAPAKFLDYDDSASYSTLPVSARFSTMPLVTLACFASTLQALLALDRVFAMFTPIFYLRISNVRTVRRFVLAVVALNTASFGAESATGGMLGCMVARDCESVADGSYASFQGSLPRVSLLTLSFGAQVVCCSMIFGKMLHRLLRPLAAGHGIAGNARKLVPFYLLYGTCAINLVGVLLEIATFAWEIAQYDTFAEKIPRPLKNFLDHFLSRFRLSLISLCSTSGLFVHLLVSSCVRDAARASLSCGAKRIAAVLTGAVKRLLAAAKKCGGASNVVHPAPMIAS